MKSNRDIYIVGIGSLSAMGASHAQTLATYAEAKPCFQKVEFAGELTHIAPLHSDAENLVEKLRSSSSRYAELDRATLLSILTSREAYAQAGWNLDQRPTVINIGSSRGATETLEQNISRFIKEGKVSTLSSPTTTSGNISSWAAQDLALQGAAFSHSITCSTAMHAVGNAVAWLRSGMAERALVGGSEAPLTPFTIAQMKALRLYSKDLDSETPCRPCKDRNTLILGEGACVLALQSVAQGEILTQALAKIEQIGFAQEQLTSNTSISEEGEALQRSMRQALDGAEGEIDAIVLHAPGSGRGDEAELAAVNKVFGNTVPAISSTKWIFGHTFGASGAFSLEAALYMIKTSQVIEFPYAVPFQSMKPKGQIRRVLVNATGFGGNAVSVVVSMSYGAQSSSSALR